MFSFKRLGIDSHYKDRLFVLAVYNTTDGNSSAVTEYMVKEWEYGSILTNRVIQKEVNSAYISF